MTDFSFIRAADLKPAAPDWRVKGYIEADSLALLFGAPATYKSFVAADIGCSVAAGVPWHGHRVKQAAVALVIGEGQNGFGRRLKAWAIRNKISLADLPIFVSTAPADMLDGIATVLSALDEIVKAHGTIGLVVLDTLARNFGAGDENSTADMGRFVGAADMIRRAYGCTVLIVHHTGHAASDRARGSVALRAAVDTEYRVDRDESGVIRFECCKMKDAAHPAPLAFTPRTVELGIVDEDGEQVTSVVLDATDPPAKKGKGLTAVQRHAVQSFLSAAKASGTTVLSLEEWRTSFYASHTGETTEAKRKAFERVRKSLQSAGMLKVHDDTYRLTQAGQPGHVPDTSRHVPDGQDNPLQGVSVVRPGADEYRNASKGV